MLTLLLVGYIVMLVLGRCLVNMYVTFFILQNCNFFLTDPWLMSCVNLGSSISENITRRVKTCKSKAFWKKKSNFWCSKSNKRGAFMWWVLIKIVKGHNKYTRKLHTGVMMRHNNICELTQRGGRTNNWSKNYKTGNTVFVCHTPTLFEVYVAHLDTIQNNCPGMQGVGFNSSFNPAL